MSEENDPRALELLGRLSDPEAKAAHAQRTAAHAEWRDRSRAAEVAALEPLRLAAAIRLHRRFRPEQRTPAMNESLAAAEAKLAELRAKGA